MKRLSISPLLLLFSLALGVFTFGAEVLQHLSLDRWSALLHVLGFDPLDAAVAQVRDLIRFQASDVFGAGFILVYCLRGSEEPSLRDSIVATSITLIVMEILQMVLRWSSFDWMDMLAYTVGGTFTVLCLLVLQRVVQPRGPTKGTQSGTVSR